MKGILRPYLQQFHTIQCFFKTHTNLEFINTMIKSDNLFQGYLYKQSGMMKNWHKKYFVLTPKELLYYNQPGSELRGTIKILNSSGIAIAKECKKQPAFTFTTDANRTYLMVAESVEDREKWLDLIHKVSVGEIEDVDQNTQFDILETTVSDEITIQRAQSHHSHHLYRISTIPLDKFQLHDEKDVVISRHLPLISNMCPFLSHLKSIYYQESTNSILTITFGYNTHHLFDYIHQQLRISSDKAFFYSIELCIAILHCHSLNILYGGLDETKFYVQKDGHLILQDPGVSESVVQEQTINEFAVPELFDQQQNWTPEADWYQCGIAIYAFYTGMYPFYSRNPEKMKEMIQKQELYFPLTLDATVTSFISHLLDLDPQKRIHDDTLLSDPFFENVNLSDFKSKKVTPPWIPNQL